MIAYYITISLFTNALEMCRFHTSHPYSHILTHTHTKLYSEKENDYFFVLFCCLVKMMGWKVFSFARSASRNSFLFAVFFAYIASSTIIEWFV